MVDMIRCPACRGAKKVAKLGGMLGKCNTCEGVGQIKECDKPKPVIVSDTAKADSELIKAVSDCVPASDVIDLPVEPQIKIDGKRAVFKKKKA